jgi:hypothetical protein
MTDYFKPVGAGTPSILMTRGGSRESRSKLLVVFLALVLAGGLMMLLGPLSGTAYGATAPNINQCNGVDNVGGQEVACTVTVTNNLNLATGAASTSVSGNDCNGAANAVPTCTPWTAAANVLSSSVTQCNGSGSGGGGTVICTVAIINNITGAASPTTATVNQCNTSGQGGGTQPTLICTPIGVTTNADVTQCNGSGNGGGGTQRVQCAVGPSTATTAVPIPVNQCVGSGNGGGSTVTCTVSETNNVVTAGGTPGGTGGTTGSGGTGGGTTGNGAGSSAGVGGSTGTSTGTGTGTGAGGGLGSVASPTPGAPGRSLAFTGSNTEATILIALLVMALGGALVAVSERSRRRVQRRTTS